jgi:hypothetical protein
MNKTKIAHRGAPNIAPYEGNTIGAFQNAVDRGFDAVSLDIRSTKDRVPIAFQYESLAKTAEINKKIEKVDYVEIKDFEHPSGQRIVTLNQIFYVFEDESELQYYILPHGGFWLSFKIIQTIKKWGVQKRTSLCLRSPFLLWFLWFITLGRQKLIYSVSRRTKLDTWRGFFRGLVPTRSLLVDKDYYPPQEVWGLSRKHEVTVQVVNNDEGLSRSAGSYFRQGASGILSDFPV